MKAKEILEWRLMRQDGSLIQWIYASRAEARADRLTKSERVVRTAVRIVPEKRRVR